MPIEVPVKTTQTPSDLKLVRCWGVDESELSDRLLGTDYSTVHDSHTTRTSGFPRHAPFRLSIVTSEKEWPRKKQIVLEYLQKGGSLNRLQEHGIYFRSPSGSAIPRIAFLFPGQGSQKVGMLADLIQSSPSAAKRLSDIDRLLLRAGGESCSPWFFSDNHLGTEESLESTQVAMLAADLCAWEIVKDWGLTPDFLLGHSFGEYAALVSAGVIDLEAAISITRARSQAVADCQHGAGAMLSISAKVSEIRSVLADRPGLYISHANSPQQTVVAGGEQQIREFAAEIKTRGIPSLQVPVTSPFHTPLLESAESRLKIALGQHRWRPPRLPLLSSVSGRFVADRDEIISNLTHQLTMPLNWIANIERLLEEDVQVFIEVGPGRVLTKLTQQIIGERQAFTLPIDDSKLDQAERKLRLQAAIETAGIPNIAMPEATTVARISDRPIADAIPVVLPSRNGVHLPLGKSAHVESGSDKQSNQISASDKPDRSLIQFLTDLVVEQTGFSADQIELDRDLEEELGIDHTRKTIILGELREYFDLPPEQHQDQFKHLRTLRDILHVLETSTGKGEWLASNVKAKPTAPQVALATAHETESSSAEVVVDDSRMDEFLIDFVMERTGYPRDVIELDVDLEADLGIDSIAKAQLIGEVRDHFQLSIDEAATRAVLGEIRTLRQIREMMGSVSTKSVKSDSVAEKRDSEDDSRDESGDASGPQTPRSKPDLTPVAPMTDRGGRSAFANGKHHDPRRGVRSSTFRGVRSWSILGQSEPRRPSQSLV